MNAGRELDALVAEKIMGERVLFVNRAWSIEDWLTSDYPTEQNVMAIVTNEDWKPGTSYPHHLVIPHYSADISAAWLVVEWAKKYGSMIIQVLPYAVWVEIHILDPVVAKSGGDIDATTDFRSACLTAATAPHAICLASLKACGVDVPS